LTYGQQYTQEQKGMSISMFQFDPLSLGISNPKPKSYHSKPHLHLRKDNIAVKYAPKGAAVGAQKKDVLSGDTRKNETDLMAMNNTLAYQKTQALRNSTTNSTSAFKEATKKLNGNPTPTSNDALEHLKNVKFDGTHKEAGKIKLLGNNTKGGNATGNITTTALKNSTKVDLPKEELLFYKNKTKDGDDGSEKMSSVKLTKTTTPDLHNGELPILQTVNATLPSNSSLYNNATAKLNNTSNFKNNSSSANRNATTALLSNQNKTNMLVAPKNGSLLPEEGLTVFDVRKRQEILSHFIPVIDVTPADRGDSFQSGSRKHKLHHMYPECYRCPKQSNYTNCVRKAKLTKCDEGLNNICFTKSHKHDGKRHISYEMGCTSHKECGSARAFPCKGLCLLIYIHIRTTE